MTTLENKILDIIDNAHDMTRSDLQGAIEALCKQLASKIGNIAMQIEHDSITQTRLLDLAKNITN